MSNQYRLDGSPYPDGLEGLMEWGQDFEDFRGRSIGSDHLWNGLHVSTVWLGLNHRYGSPGPPLIFETMVFDDLNTQSYEILGHWRQSSPEIYMDRYATLQEAEEGHRQVVEFSKSIRFTIRRWWDEIIRHVHNDPNLLWQ